MFLAMASPNSSSMNDPSGSGPKISEPIDELLHRLGIKDDEIDDLVFEEEESAPEEGVKWMALVRVHASKYFSPQSFEQTMLIV
jgi:hypothetical protein